MMFKEIDSAGKMGQRCNGGIRWHFVEFMDHQLGQKFAVIQGGMETVGPKGTFRQGYIAYLVICMVGRQVIGQRVKGKTFEFRVPGLEHGDCVEDGGGGEGKMISD